MLRGRGRAATLRSAPNDTSVLYALSHLGIVGYNDFVGPFFSTEENQTATISNWNWKEVISLSDYGPNYLEEGDRMMYWISHITDSKLWRGVLHRGLVITLRPTI